MRNETFDYNSNGLDVYPDAAIIREQPSLNVPYNHDVSTANTNDSVMNDNVSAVLHATAPIAVGGHVDLTTQSYPMVSSNETQYNYVNEQASVQDPPQSVVDTSFSLPDNSLNVISSTQYNYVNGQALIQNPPQTIMNTPFPLPVDSSHDMTLNPPQTPTDNSEIFRFAIPGFQIIVIPISSPLAYLNNFDMQNQFQQDYAFSSYNSPQLYQDNSGVYESVYEIPNGSSVNTHNYRSQSQHHQQTL